MTIDRALGQPVRPLLRPSVMLLPFALVGLLAAHFLPRGYYDLVWVPSFLVVAACVVLWTPYLLLAGLCFYAMSQLPFPTTLAFESWIYHALLLLAVIFFLSRTWSLWPTDMIRQKTSPAGASNAPWWGYALGGVVALGLFALMAYVFHFQE